MSAPISERWSTAHLKVTKLLSKLLSVLRDHGYNPSHHIAYDKSGNHLILDEDILKRHSDVEALYREYLDACAERDRSLEEIQHLPKVDLGFKEEHS
ncbi:hypothetical protein [Alicyclobacillus herbarius]|uniref:hypothetical protein n=1 Tax=Alicyclobacillus herbarius TaxID=122960 RepID=UPI000412B657|nr:hypothetical protein [Alicyclobacillus herbarius]